MGMIFGKVGVETPEHDVISSADHYEVRKYPPAVVAEVTYDPAQFKYDKDGGFTILANYIGAFGKPQNTKPEKIAMTAPVLTPTVPSEKIAMTAPVLTPTVPSEKIAMIAPVVTTSDGEMVTIGFILPSKYARAEDAPRPLDERVALREEGARKYGVVTFSGVAREDVVAEKVGKLRECLERDGYKVTGDFVLARYNPPWLTLPPFRTNSKECLFE